MKITNTLTRNKETFTPLKPNKVSMYVCGVTVYDRCHIGHARTYLSFDIMIRFMRYMGMNVTYVRNITDIDDKIINRANERKISMEELLDENIAKMYEDFDALNILRPDIEPRATTTIPGIIEVIKELIQKEYAYAADNGDVYYRVNKFEGYGKLSGQKLEDLQAGSRVEIDNAKENPMDFVLWKAAKPGEPKWESPWGDGRPGWHIECSAMTRETLGKHFDIHGGGSDLCFPHHENEIAQSMVVNGGTYANYWIHSGMVKIDGEKMSKSLGNFFIIHDVLKVYSPEIIRYFLISAHYRSEINYSTDNLDFAKAALTRFYTSLRGITPGAAPRESDYRDRFINAMEDDFNTPIALATLFDLVRELNKSRDPDLAALLLELGGVLGILQDSPEAFLKVPTSNDAEVDVMVEARVQARADKNWAESDRLRDELVARGIILEDGPDGTSWRRS